MKRVVCESKNADIRASVRAMARAARAARKLAEATGTPLYFMRNGKIVNANPNARRGPRTAA